MVSEKRHQELADAYTHADDAMLKILYAVAESGVIAPVVFAAAIRRVPGYDPARAPQLENQWFGGDGFPLPEKPEEEE